MNATTDMIMTLAIAAVFFGMIKLMTAGMTETGVGEYKRRPVMTEYEQKLYYALINVIDGEFAVLAQVQMTGFIEPKGGKGRQSRLNLIHRKSVDYLICEKQTMQPLAAIELQDWTHRRRDRQHADRQKAAALKAAGVPLIEFHKLPTYGEIKEKLRPYMRQHA